MPQPEVGEKGVLELFREKQLGKGLPNGLASVAENKKELAARVAGF
jgi:hypothetical protein